MDNLVPLQPQPPGAGRIASETLLSQAETEAVRACDGTPSAAGRAGSRMSQLAFELHDRRPGPAQLIGACHFCRGLMMAFFYLDPTYVLSTRSQHSSNRQRLAYVNEMTDADHQALGAALNALKGKAIVSSYRSELYDTLFADWHRIDIEHEGKPLTKTAQVRMCGNSVSPPMGSAIILANVGATRAMGPSLQAWEPGMVKSGEQLALFDLAEAIA